MACRNSLIAAIAAVFSCMLLLVPLSAENLAQVLPVDPAVLVAVTPGGEKTFTIEVADDAGERSTGLMFRETMADDRGMLFVFERTQPVSFWMKNTPMPLDLIFIGEDGTVSAVLPGEPFSEAAISPGEPVRFVLELKAGAAKKAGIVEGIRLRHPLIERIAANPG